MKLKQKKSVNTKKKVKPEPTFHKKFEELKFELFFIENELRLIKKLLVDGNTPSALEKINKIYNILER